MPPLEKPVAKMRRLSDVDDRREIVEQRRRELHVVALRFFHLRRHAAGVPSEDDAVAAGTVGIHDDEACLVGLLVQAGERDGDRTVRRGPVVAKDDRRRPFRIVRLRHVHEITALMFVELHRALVQAGLQRLDDVFFCSAPATGMGAGACARPRLRTLRQRKGQLVVVL